MISLHKSRGVMAFTVQDFHDLIGILEQHPEWRTELRRLVLTEELLSLPQIMHDLAEAQQRTEQRVEELAEAQRRTEQHLADLVAAQWRTEQRIGRLQDDVGDLKGVVMEERYHRRASSYFSRLVRRSQVISGNELTALLAEAVARGALSEEGAGDRLREPNGRLTLCPTRSMPSNNAKHLLSYCFAVTEHLRDALQKCQPAHQLLNRF
jgi:hypothetical protein